jgi:hypothetical protein
MTRTHSTNAILWALTGGLRDRMIIECVTKHIEDRLTSLGWFDPGRQHLPIVLVDEYPDEDSEPPLNTLAFSTELGTGQDSELGTIAELFSLTMYVDFFAENDAIGRHLVGDIYAFLKENRVLSVTDLSLVDPTIEFFVEVDDDVETRKSARSVNAWQRHWYICAFTLTDERSN